MDEKLNSLPRGGTLKLGERTFAERSGDGKTLRFVRVTGNVTEAFRDELCLRRATHENNWKIPCIRAVRDSTRKGVYPNDSAISLSAAKKFVETLERVI